MDADSLLVGRYQLGRQIGAGGIGQVWTAHDLVLGREVAIKVQEIDPDLDGAAFERFVREARSAAALQHPNVVTIFDSGTDQDTAFLVMELLPGPTLTGFLAPRGPLSEQEAVDLAAQVASGLAAAHGAGVVHRDIKPANLMFDAHGRLKIVDFGIARLTQAATRLTATNAVIGSPPYLSPEQLHGQPADERSDIYCLGGVLMTMLTGRAPFEGTHPLALLQQHLDAAAPQVRDRRPGIDPALNALVAEMLSKWPQDRPQSAREVLSRLTGSTVEAPYASAPTAAGAPGQWSDLPSPVEAFPAVGSGRPRRRSLLGAGFLAGAGAMALVAAVVIVMASRAQAPTASQLEPSPLAARLPTVAIAGGSERSPTAPTPSEAQTGPTEPSPRSSTPIAAKTRSARPSPGVSTSTQRSGPTASRPPASRTAETESGGPSLDPALTNLRAAVDEVSSNGGIGAKEAADLGRRVDGLAQQLERKWGAEATRKVDEFDRYLTGLTGKEKLTPEGEQRIAAALSELRDVVADS
jgi:eukaryotic-like serine/threonine-protein kinase